MAMMPITTISSDKRETALFFHCSFPELAGATVANEEEQASGKGKIADSEDFRCVTLHGNVAARRYEYFTESRRDLRTGDYDPTAQPSGGEDRSKTH